MQVTVKSLSGKKKSLVQDDYINPSGLPLLIERSQTKKGYFYKKCQSLRQNKRSLGFHSDMSEHFSVVS